MIQVYADDALIYDSRLTEYELLSLKITRGLNKGGTAEFTMPEHHPTYSSLVSYRSIIRIYRDDKLLFRGRVLYPEDDFMRRRTIVCEGERCFLRDAIARPYLYQNSPTTVFTELIEYYNSQVEEFKQFVVGTVTVTDPNDYVRLESDSAEPVLSVLDKLVERAGGVVVFTTNEAGQRVINWYASVDYRSSQVIEFGENLIDFKRTANADLATRLIPYGAKEEVSGVRLTIESVNDGLDFIQDDEAVALRGLITQSVTWDDVTTPDALLTKARQYLATSKNIITSLELTAFDLSLLNRSIDSFDIGDHIKVRSIPHGVDDFYQLREQSLDLLHPADDRITLGKSVASLTGADVAGDRQVSQNIQQVLSGFKAEAATNAEALVEETKQSLVSLIQQTSDAIITEVSELYATNGQLESAITTSMTQLSDSFEFLFSGLQAVVDANDADARAQFAEFEKYIRFQDGNIILGESGNEITLRIENDRISFLDSGAEVAYFSNKHLTVLDGTFLNSLQVGHFRFLPRDNGNLSLVRVGD